ncbi:MAG: MscL family protein, partial [Clostridia bacterium]|nr:MscL family protein [Clostridia bacterium]
MKKLLKEFKEFAMRGNVVDMAIGVVIGAAFGKVVTAVVEIFLNPIIEGIKAKLPEGSAGPGF